MVQDTKNFIRITRDDSNDVGIFIVESFKRLGNLFNEEAIEDSRKYDTLTARMEESGFWYIFGRINRWTFQEGTFNVSPVTRTKVIHGFVIDADDDITEEDLPIFVNEDDDAGLIELEMEPQFTSLHDAIMDVLGEGPLDRLGISTRIYQKYNKSINPDRIKGALGVLIHSGEVMEKDNGTLNPLYIHATKPFRSFRQVIEEMANQDLQFKAPETFDWTMKCAAVYFAIKNLGGLTTEGIKNYIEGVFSLARRYVTEGDISGMLKEMESAGLVKKHIHYGNLHWHRADRNYCHCGN